jgi:hypothetical protein
MCDTITKRGLLAATAAAPPSATQRNLLFSETPRSVVYKPHPVVVIRTPGAMTIRLTYCHSILPATAPAPSADFLGVIL